MRTVVISSAVALVLLAAVAVAGVVVVGVRPDSKAYKAGVQQGDLILEVNRRNVTSTGELKQLLANHKGGDGVSLLVQRGNAGMMVLKMV